MKVFLDTNILLDLLLERDGYVSCGRIFELQEAGKLSICVSVLTMINVAYVYRKTVGQDMATVNLKFISTMVEVLPMDSDMLQRAIYLKGRDFEDLLQAVCASKGLCDVIITRNTKDYSIKKSLRADASLPRVCTPWQFLEEFAHPE
jgi:predicted nucleic acid-binding protein